jgi:hypothetical protein
MTATTTDPTFILLASIDRLTEEQPDTLRRILREAGVLPHDRVLQLLRDLNVQMFLKPPRSKEERALHGLTPPKERVIVRFLVDPDEAAQGRLSDKKLHDLSSRSR